MRQKAIFSGELGARRLTKEEARQARIEAEEKVMITMMMRILTGEDLYGPKGFDPKLARLPRLPKALRVYHNFLS